MSFQIWVCLALFGVLALAAGFAYAALCIFPGLALDGAQRRGVLYLAVMLLTADLFAAKLIALRVTQPFEHLAENMSRVKNKNWSEPIRQMARKDEIGQIVNTLSQIQRNVVEINEDEEFFYQSVSHGLKTPIMVIQNCCTAYVDGIYGGEAIDIIMKESQKLEDGIQKLLYVSSFDHMLGKRSDFQPVALGDLAEDCRCRFLGNENGIQLLSQVPPDCFVMGNAASLQTVIDNLVENGLRYAQSQIRIWVEREGGHLILVVENDGAPIPKQVMDTLFEKFYKGAGGHFGLGLYIAKKIVMFHGGDIWADNYDQGVRFHVLLNEAADQPQT